jgi:hypothetical protein
MPREAAVRQPQCADSGGFSLHAAVRIEAHDRRRLERLSRYIARPALSDERIRVKAAGKAATGAAGEIRGDAQPVPARAQPIGWARLLRRVFDIDMLRSPNCGALGAEDHRGDPGARGDREGPHPTGVGPRPPPRGQASEAGFTGHAFAAD